MPIYRKKSLRENNHNLGIQTGINYQNPIAKNLIVYANNDIDLVSGKKLALTGPLKRELIGDKSLLTVSSTTPQYLTIPIPQNLDSSNDGWTILIFCAWSGDINTRTIAKNPQGRPLYAGYLNTFDVEFDSGLISGPDNEWPANKFALVGQRAKYSTRRYSVLVDDKEIAGYTRGAALGDILAGDMIVGYVDSTWQNSISVAHVLVWNRCVEDKEIASLVKNPWQLLAPKTRTIVLAASGGTSISATTDALTLTEQQATINAATQITATTRALTLATYVATVQLTVGTNVQAATQVLTLTTNTATVNAAKDIQASLASLNLTANPATVVLDTGTAIAAAVSRLYITTYRAIVDGVSGKKGGGLSLTEHEFYVVQAQQKRALARRMRAIAKDDDIVLALLYGETRE